MPGLTRDDALFLDFDGTLADLADRPDAVVVAPGLVDGLNLLRGRLGGALAIVSGRSIAQIDNFLAPLELPAAGVHGAERRRIDGVTLHMEHTIPDDIVESLEGFAALHAGVLVEVKPGAVALHYRMAPELEKQCIAAMQHAAAHAPGCAVLLGKKVAELKPVSADKGAAITAFLEEPPFKGRRPVFAGDDMTDEGGFAVVQARGGIAIKVGTGPSIATHSLASPKALRHWIHRITNDLDPARLADELRSAKEAQ